jgi:cytochrome c-type biogenesis protein CcmH
MWALITTGMASDRYETLIHEYRCVVCQGQSIAESTTPVAISMRNQVRKMLDEGKSDEAIDQYFIERFGEGVKLSPIKKQKHWVLWFFPGLLLLGLIYSMFKRFRSL